MKTQTADLHRFSLTTLWEFDSPLERVWNAISGVDDWPQWWPYLEQVETLMCGDRHGIGALRRLTWRTRLPYRIAFDLRATLVEPPFALDGEAAGGVQGIGRWRLSRQRSRTVVRYQWDVTLTQAWMVKLAPIARPAFEWNHHAVMSAGGRGLARHLV